MSASILVFLAAAYFVPALIALGRNHRQRGAIALLNLLLGWTVVGWVVAAVWSMTSDIEPNYVEKLAAQKAADVANAEFVTCPQCAETIRRAAKICRFCSSPLDPPRSTAVPLTGANV